MHHADDRANVLRLYEELGVRPEDGLPRLSERYRARLHALHPDTGGAAHADVGWLTRSYREAVAFHARHGRLPGADGAHADGMHAPLPALRAARPRRRRRWRWVLPVALVLAAAALLRWIDL